MPPSSIPPETVAQEPSQLQQRLHKLEETVAEMKEFETFLLNINRCFIEAVQGSNANLLRNAHTILVIIDGVCGIRYEHEHGLLKTARERSNAHSFLVHKLGEISLMLTFQEELVPLKKLIIKLQGSLFQTNPS